MRIAVFGTGGVGGYFGARLASIGVDVVFIARGEHLKAIRTNGLRLESVLGDALIHPAQASDSPKDIGQVDVIILGCKTWQVPDAIEAIRPCVGSNTFVLPLQNGVETPAILAKKLGFDHVIGGLCALFSFIEGPGHIRHIGGANFIKFGELNNKKTARVEQLRSAFEQANVTVEVPDDIQVALWEKCMIVVPSGGLGAVTSAPLGPLLTVPETRRLLEQAIKEVCHVAKARGVMLSGDTVEKTIKILDETTPSGCIITKRYCRR